MKAVIISLFALVSFSAMANNISSAVYSVEAENRASCTEVDRSTRKCINTACVYKIEYFCRADAADFTTKVGVIEYLGLSGEKVVKATSVKVIR